MFKIRFYFMAFAIALLSLTQPAQAQAQYQPQWIDPPIWVEEMPLPSANPDRMGATSDGIYYLLDDVHRRWEDGVKHTYFRVAREIVGRAGLEAAGTFQMDFNWPLEEMDIAHITVHRGDQRIELGQETTVNVFRREDDLESGIVDGALTAYVDIPNVQVGDIVDWAVVFRAKPYFETDTQYTINRKMAWSVPVTTTRLRVDWPKGVPMHVLNGFDDLPAEKQELPKHTRMTWARIDPEPLVYEEGMPAWYPWQRRVEMAAIDSWGAVVETLMPHYQDMSEVPRAWRAQVDEIGANSDDLAERTRAALTLVQENIRYVGIEVGTGGFLARRPETVVQNGFGDCKDKSVLLRAILQDLGVEAELVLVNTSVGEALTDRMPSLFAFDHMIVRAKVNGVWVWMDPTLHSQGGDLAHLVQPDYGYGLPLVAGSSALESMDTHDTDLHQLDEEQRFEFVKGDGVNIRVTGTYRFAFADWKRNNILSEGLASVDKVHFEYLSKTYPGLTRKSPMKMVNHGDQNMLILTELYHLPEADLKVPELFEEFPFNPDMMYTQLRAVDTKRVHPLFLSENYKLSSVINVFNAPINFNPPPKTEIDNTHFDFNVKGRNWTNGQSISWTFATKKTTLEPEDVTTYRADRKLMREVSGYNWDLTPVEEPSFWEMIKAKFQ